MKKIKLKLEDSIVLWKPSAYQKKVLEVAVNDDTNSINKWFEKAGVKRSLWNEWTKNDKFVDWWNHEWNKAMRATVTYLDKIGLEMAKVDFRYWEAMQKKYGGYQESKQGTGVNIQFNIPRPPERISIDGETIDPI